MGGKTNMNSPHVQLNISKILTPPHFYAKFLIFVQINIQQPKSHLMKISLDDSIKIYD